MRWLPLLLVLATAQVVAAHPLPPDSEYKPKPACKATSSWSTFAKCQLGKIDFELVHDAPTVKLVSYENTYARGSRRLELYTLTNGAWVKLGLYAETNASTELLSFKAVDGGAYRLDMGFAQQTWVTLDEMGARPAMLRRGYTYVCGANGCPSVVTSCELFVHGKVVASFRATPTWDGRSLRINGIAQNTNRYCPAPPGLVPPGEVP